MAGQQLCPSIPLIMQRCGSENRQVMAEDPLCKSPLDTDLSEFLRNQANMAQIEHLQLESGFQSLVRQAMSRRWDKSQELSFPFSRAGKTWEHVVVIASTDLQTWLSATSSLHLVTREGHAANTAHQNAVVFLHLLVLLLLMLVYLGLVTMAMLILRCWLLIMIITALEYFCCPLIWPI